MSNEELKLSKVEDIIDQVDKLLMIDSDNLDAEALRNTRIFAEINRIYIREARLLTKLDVMKNKVEIKRFRFYSGKETSEHYKKEPLRESLLKTDIPQHMNIDPQVIEIRAMYNEQEKIVKFLEESKWTLKSRGEDIKNAIAWRRLMMGA